ncbi:MAG: YjbQ family protein [Alteromonadaceae bacterium]|nr:YjbQ family protein [Alteromonadaceae bacterium]
MWQQKTVELSAKPRGFHLITDEIYQQLLPELSELNVGLVHFLLCHTSASLSINENADPTVRSDMENYINHLVPEGIPYLKHTYEGDDDMPAHIKSSLFGSSICVPVSDGRFSLGTWQGIYLGEHRNHGGSRRIIATLQGE